MKIQAIRIELERLEGPAAECGKKTCSGPNPWQEANETLRAWSESAPKDGCYDKTSFKIKFANDDEYAGRIDLQHWSIEVPDLGRHILEHLKFMAGLWRPASITPEQYAKVLEKHEDAKQTYQGLLDNYDIPEGPEGSRTVVIKVLTENDFKNTTPAEERLAMIRKIYEIAYRCTESFEEVDPAENNPPIGGELAYLFGAIASPYMATIEVYRGNSDLLQLLEENFPEDHPVWNHVDVVGETVPAESEQVTL